jgi:hypothetical protein
VGSRYIRASAKEAEDKKSGDGPIRRKNEKNLRRNTGDKA